MEEASLNELMPGFDKGAEWTLLSEKLHVEKKRPLYTWRRAAAVLLLVVVGSIVSMFVIKDDPTGNIAAATDTGNEHNWVADVSPAMPSQHTTGDRIIKGSNGNEMNRPVQTTNVMEQPGRRKTSPPLSMNGYHRTKEFVCNGTPCPIEICIIQTIYCKDQKPAAIATCNTLEPDQARQLHYKAPEGAGKQCKVTVDEIRIRRVTTGETIVLNAHSKPSTAQELFNCITGKDKCDLLAGIFEADCDNEQRSHSLKIDNNLGSLIME